MQITLRQCVDNLMRAKDVKHSIEVLSTAGLPGLSAILKGLELKNRDPSLDDGQLIECIGRFAQKTPEVVYRALRKDSGHTLLLLGCLEETKEAKAGVVLVRYLSHTNSLVRLSAVSSIIEHHTVAQYDSVLTLLADRSKYVASIALFGLSKYPDRRAIEPVRKYLSRKGLSTEDKDLARKFLAKCERKRS